MVSLEEEDLTQYNIGANPHRQINEMLVQLLRLGLFLSSYGKVRNRHCTVIVHGSMQCKMIVNSRIGRESEVEGRVARNRVE